jgi:bacillithiol biosynthesis cysteine-adding enzyme BshC
VRAAGVKTVCIPFREIPQTSSLFSTFLENPELLSAYYSHPPSQDGIAAAARALKFGPEWRQALVDILRDQNARFSSDGMLDRVAEKNLGRLSSGAVAIVTGQQVGLFSGPALTIYKALSAICVADETTRRGVDAVPIFWLATEDHDLAEVNESDWNTRQGLAHYKATVDPSNEGKCVGQIVLGESIEAIVQEAATTLDGPATAEMTAMLRESYTARDTYGSAFAKLLARLFSGRGLLIIDPADARFDRVAAPLYQAAIEKAEELRGALRERSQALEEAGYHAQVKVTDESTLLFYGADGKREALRTSKADEFAAGQAKLTKAELLAALKAKPELFTASALLRPVLQDTILPTAAIIGGPAEIAYLAQSGVIYPKLLGRMPAILTRVSFTIVEAPIARFLDQYELEIRDLFRGKQYIRAKMEQQTMPDALSKKFDEDETVLRRMIGDYRQPLARLDPTLTGAAQAIEEKILGLFLKLKEKVGRAENFRTGVLDRHEKIILDALYANHQLQERHLSALPHLAAHGRQLLDEIVRVITDPAAGAGSSCAGQHHVLFLD